MGRVLGSLCVLTAKDGDAEGAMLASWVSQVSVAGALASRSDWLAAARAPGPTPAPTRRALRSNTTPQASFDPPGLTVAVKKDRAIESLLPVGAAFVLNILAEGKEKGAMKQARPRGSSMLCGLPRTEVPAGTCAQPPAHPPTHSHACAPPRSSTPQMLKPFKPAEDRFVGVEVQRAEGSGAVVLPEAAAYVECSVSSRMDAGDHVLLYATVGTGKVLDDTALSAVHYRKTGTNY